MDKVRLVLHVSRITNSLIWTRCVSCYMYLGLTVNVKLDIGTNKIKIPNKLSKVCGYVRVCVCVCVVCASECERELTDGMATCHHPTSTQAGAWVKGEIRSQIVIKSQATAGTGGMAYGNIIDPRWCCPRHEMISIIPITFQFKLYGRIRSSTTGNSTVYVQGGITVMAKATIGGICHKFPCSGNAKPCQSHEPYFPHRWNLLFENCLSRLHLRRKLRKQEEVVEPILL